MMTDKNIITDKDLLLKIDELSKEIKRLEKLGEIGALKIENRDFDKDLDIRGYLKLLLTTLWKEGEGFSGKRPFGNSGWEWDISKPLIKAGLIEGKIDEEGYIEECNDDEADKIILELIESL